MKQVLLVTATKTKTLDEFKQRPLAKSLQILSDVRYTEEQFDFEIVRDNSTGLPEVYNRFLNEKNKDKIIVFVHDDLEIHDLFLVEKLNESSFDITGLAGASTYEVKDKNLWHTCSKRDSHTGSVTHPLCWQEGNEIKKDLTKQITTVFGPVPQRCLVLDGLFMAVDVSKALEAGWTFDTNHSFHHYDISSCLLANKKKMKLGTIDIKTLHYGLGDSFMSPEWEKSNETFKKTHQKA